MTTATLTRVALDPGLSLLPPRMDTPEARVMLVAIAWQESRIAYRRQMPVGPARGFWQFEMGGVLGVFKHAASRDHVRDVLTALAMPQIPSRVHAALEWSDPLACVFARLLLWTLPMPLPRIDEMDAGLAQYLDAWRPGRPRPEKWPESWRVAVEAVTGTNKEAA